MTCSEGVAGMPPYGNPDSGRDSAAHTDTDTDSDSGSESGSLRFGALAFCAGC